MDPSFILIAAIVLFTLNPILTAIGILLAVFLVVATIVIRGGVGWGSTPEEREFLDSYFDDRRRKQWPLFAEYQEAEERCAADAPAAG